MSPDAVITLVVVAIAIVLFVIEYYSVDVVALGVMVTLSLMFWILASFLIPVFYPL